MFLRRLVFVYGGLLVIFAVRTAKRWSMLAGRFLESLTRKLVSFGEDRPERWDIELLLKCDMVDVEFHIGGIVYRGPAYAVYRSFVGGDALVFRCNWIASSSDSVIRDWEYSGAMAFRITEYTAPVKLPNGDRYFGFPGGYGILFLGRPRSRLFFKGRPDTPREFAYF